MNKIKKLILAIFVLFGIIILGSLVSSSYTQTNAFSSVGRNTFDMNYNFDAQECEAGQDFILQIDPFGCTPSVVRSDLLEEQNVPVFCEIQATKINPLINVEAIDYISFQGDYPEEVSGVGFYPAQAAIKGENLLNSPILENIGYAVIVLKQTKNESAMPDFVEGTLTANLKYDVKNAFGVGKTQFYLPELSKEEEWVNRYKQYGFWNGRAYLRAESIGDDQALISVYRDDDKKIASFDLNQGEVSREFYLPGFYCLASTQVKLNGLENPDTTVKLDIDGEIVEVKDNEMFLENKCKIVEPDKSGIIEKVAISCKDDEGKSQKFTLAKNPKIKLKIGEEEGEYEVGQRLSEITLTGLDASTHSVYLSAVYTKGNSGQEEDLVLFLVKEASKEDKLEIGEISKDYYKKYARFFIQGTDALGDLFSKDFSGKTEAIEVGAIENKVFGSNLAVEFVGLAEPKDVEYETNTEFAESFSNAIKDYKTLLNDFPNEKEHSENDVEKTYAQQGLLEAIDESFKLNQKATTNEFCELLTENYPDEKIPNNCKELAQANSEISSESVLIDGRIRTISFLELNEPDFEDYGVAISVVDGKGNQNSFELTKNTRTYISEKEYIQIIRLEEDKVYLQIVVQPKVISTQTAQQAATKVAGQDAAIFKNVKLKEIISDIGKEGYVISVDKINLQKIAKVSVMPSVENTGTEANFSFHIGIEKRGIQLAPEEIQKKIDSLNETITQWEKISDSLDTTVKTLKGACIATSGILTLKNFIQNAGGKSIARQEVMRGDGGWFDRCEEEVANGGSKSVDACLLENSDEIDGDVDSVYDAIKNQDKITEENLDDTLTNIKSELNGETYVNPNDKTKSVTVKDGEDIYAALSDESKISLQEARDIQRLQMILDSNPSPELKEMTENQMYTKLSQIENTYQGLAKAKSLEDSLTGLKNIKVVVENDNRKIEPYYGTVTDSAKYGYGEAGGEVQPYVAGGETYILKLEYSKSANTYSVKEIYDEKGDKIENGDESISQKTFDNLKNKRFAKYDSTSYQNNYISAAGENVPVARYHETEPYKGLPALVPFDKTNGWYVATKQTIPIALFGKEMPAYDDSGKVSSFYLCNVMADGIEQFDRSSGDDECTQFNPGTGSIYGTFPGLSDSATRKLTDKAIDAIEEASSQYKSGVKAIKISGFGTVKVGNPAVNIPGMQCQDFMSPSDCNILFNVCDPVICPTSRCNLGGNYYVDNVIQSGIVGSIALCLPNFKGFGGDVIIPVCLSGIKAGVDGLLSIFTAYRDCLQESLDTGQTVGICDEVHSIYLCEFFWRQTVPAAKLIVPKLLEFATGQGGHGGGEYLGIATAWENAESSIDYMTQVYGVNSYKAFKSRTTDEVGTEVCKVFASARYPASGEFFDALLESDSPPQFHGRFDEIPFTTATVPATSQYKVFYHIYAGKDSGAYYKVILKSPSGSSFFSESASIVVDSGYIGKGQYADETKDFTATSGYKELCIVVNEQEECGFGEVSTSFAVEYIKEQYLKEQASAKDITSAKDCVSGTPSMYSILNPNLQEGADDVLNPELYNEGIIRICSTSSPGKNTDGKDQTNESRWVDVGYCDSESGVKCWLDIQSVKDVVDIDYIEEGILGEHYEDYMNKLISGSEYKTEAQADVLIEEIKKLDAAQKISKIIEVFGKIFFSNQKAQLLFIRAGAYMELAGDNAEKAPEISEAVIKKDSEGKKEVNAEGEKMEDGDGIPGVGETTSGGDKIEEINGPELPDPILDPAANDSGLLGRLNTYNFLIGEVSSDLGLLDKNLIKAIIAEESDAQKDAIGDGGASYGLMQISVPAVEYLLRVHPDHPYASHAKIFKSSEKNRFMPSINVELGSLYYGTFFKRYLNSGNSNEEAMKLALCAYNWGPTAVKENCNNAWSTCQNVPSETLQYVSNVLGYYNAFSFDMRELGFEPR